MGPPYAQRERTADNLRMVCSTKLQVVIAGIKVRCFPNLPDPTVMRSDYFPKTRSVSSGRP